MNGWKTKAAAIISILYGVIGLFLGMHDAESGMQFVIQGLGLLGIGHKIEKAGINGAN